ncbi:kinase-like domain-containing protein [Xylaria castorea]|nr:kinase-like domain-containing protein [Xylaria castorea]
MKNEKIDVFLARHIASGAFSDVYELEVTIVPESSTRNIAIKSLKSISDARNLFQAESNALLRLAKTTDLTTSIIHLLTDPFESEHDLAFFLPLAHSNLESYLADNGISDRLTPVIWQQFSSLTVALSIIHGENIVHGDLKPDNILVFKSGNTISFKIADFGHSVCDRITGRLATDATAYSLNPSYSALELWNRSATDLRLYDIWALGCILLEVTVLMRDGTEEVKLFRKKLMSPIGRITTSTFHDGYRLKPHVCQYLDDLSVDPVFRQLSSTLRGMLMEESSLRLTASPAADALRDFDGINSQPPISQKIYLPIQSSAQRVNIMLKNSDVSLNQILMFFILPILIGFLISALAISYSMRLAISLVISHPTFWILILCTTYYHIGTPRPRALYSRLRVWLSLDEECPFPDCLSRAAGTKLPYPGEWCRHVVNEHSSNIDCTSRPIVNSAAPSNPQIPSNISLGSIVLSPREPVSTSFQQPSGSSPLHGNTSSGVDNQNLDTRHTMDQALDLCFPEFHVEDLHQWKDLEYNGLWSDEALFQKLAHAYYSDTLWKLRLSSHRGIRAMKSMVSFTQLSQIRPTKVSLSLYQIGECEILTPSSSTLLRTTYREQTKLPAWYTHHQKMFLSYC